MKWNWHGIHSDLVESIGVIYLEIIIDSNNNIMRDIGTDFPKYILSILYCHHFGWQMFIRRKWTKKSNVLLFHCSHFGQLNHSVVVSGVRFVSAEWTKAKTKSKLNCMCLNLVNTRFMAFKVIFWPKRSTTTKSGDSITYLAPSLILLAAQDKSQRDTFKDQNAIHCMC